MSWRILLVLFLAVINGLGQEIPYTVADNPWNDELGNQRAKVRALAGADAVRVHLPWRRHDAGALAGPIAVFAAPDGPQVRDVFVVSRSSESADLVFAPVKDVSEYFVYTMPHAPAPTRRNSPPTAPAWQELTTDPGWAAKVRERAGELAPATVIAFEARTQFDSFYPMEVAATAEELHGLRERYPAQPYLLFPEDRRHSIRMLDRVPLRWIQRGSSDELAGAAMRGEFFVWQVGVYAQEGLTTGSRPIRVVAEPLRGPGGVTATVRCLNRNPMIAPGMVAPLWFGAEIPLKTAPGMVEGSITIQPEGAGIQSVKIRLQVGADHLRDGGVDDPARLSRLKWLDSAIGTGDVITKPYTPLQVTGTSVACLGRTVRFGPGGLPDSVKAGATELLAKPVTLTLWKSGAALTLTPKPSRVVSQSAATVVLESESSGGPVTVRTRATMEFDGGVAFDVSVASSQESELSEVALEMAMPQSRAPLIAGMGLKGGYRPKEWAWKFGERPGKWAEQGSSLEYFIWLGDADGGLYLKLKSPRDDWEASADSGVELKEEGRNVMLRARGGARKLEAGTTLHYNFRLLPTPVKPLPADPLAVRYAHDYRPIDEVAATGANVLNIHHATPPNLWINYPFLNLDLLGPYVQEAHRAGLKLKIYYTIRELTTRLPELWAFRSFGDEIYRVGGVQGHGQASLDYWLREHLVSGYAAAWVTRVPGGEIDAAIRTRPVSRLNNFYVEGLKWLLENVQIDGLYLDEIGYPREMMQRVRRVMDSARPGSLIDLHGNREWWSCNSPVGYYMEHLPYIDQVWFGEEFNPDWEPEFWLVEMSGIPFGLFGEMLQNPNPWRGMLFGMTAREHYSGPSPSPLWKLWTESGMSSSRMLGWWRKDCPVKTGRADVPATVYRGKGKSLIAVASWSRNPAKVKLKIDWKALGLTPRKLSAPGLEGFQPAAQYGPDDEIPVAPGKGLLLEVR